jgi:hypothetical protein
VFIGNTLLAIGICVALFCLHIVIISAVEARWLVNDSNTMIINTKPRSAHTTTAKQQPNQQQLKAELYSSPVKQQQAVVLNSNGKQLDVKDIEAHCYYNTTDTADTSCSDTATTQVRDTLIYTCVRCQCNSAVGSIQELEEFVSLSS